MQNIVWKLILIVVILALCTLSLFNQELRLGKDLRGGVSLVYKVSMPEDVTNPQDVLTQTIDVLKERVNPTGVLDLSMQPLGRDRIEVVMPLPNAEVRALARTYQNALQKLLEAAEIPSDAVDEALRSGTLPATLGGAEGTDRAEKAVALQEAYDRQTAARAALEAAGDADEAERSRLETEVAAAEIAFEDLRNAFLDLSLEEARVRRTLALPTTPQKLKNEDGTSTLDADGVPIEGPSQREDALARLRSEFGHVAGMLDETVAAFDAYSKERKGFDDPEDLIRLLRGAGVLEFHIAVTNSQPDGVDAAALRAELQENGPGNTSSPLASWYPINQLKQWYETPEELAFLEADPVNFFAGRDLVADKYEGTHYLLCFDTAPKSLTHDQGREWTVTRTFPSVDQLGRPAVAFNFDAAGGGLMGRLTGGNLKRPMAIVLDGEVYSAPTIQSQINTNGQITGNFSQDEIDYLTRVLAAGQLQSRLSPEPIAMNTLGPSIGQDNYNRGTEAFVIAVVAVAIFMLIYYLFAGVVAVVALIANGIIIFGVMKAIDGTFTLPGLAGIVLTIGMAVDANVLIYERIREEIFDGELDLRGAVRQGYRKALSTILDANITNLIVCFVLFKTATTEVKGFALTLTIGICATLFTALFVTRQLFYLYTDLGKARKLPMLPTVFPAIHRALEPNIDWIGLRKAFWTVSVVAVLGSVVIVNLRGVDMFDTEFRGGVSLTMLTAPIDDDGDGEADVNAQGDPVRLTLPHTGPDGVEERIRAIGRAAVEDTTDRGRVLAELRNAAILTAGEATTDESGRIVAEAFQVKVASPRGIEDDAAIDDVIVEAIVSEFGEALDVTPPLTYTGADDDVSKNYVFPIRKPELGKNLKDRPEATQRVPGFLGGAAILIEDVDPPARPEDIEDRIDRMRNQQDFARYSGRKVKVFGLTPADPTNPRRGYRDLVIVVSDPYRSYLTLADTSVWWEEVADAEWSLVAAALQQPTSLKQVSSYSSAVADTLAANAIVAVVLTLLGILVYIWVRFGSLRYSVAAIVALVHDVTIALGLLALSGVVGGTALGSALLIEPFRIDLGVVAALLTIIGYSLNDTIVILDRIRENRGKLPLPTAPIVNRSINQTVSRTLLTSVTTLVAVLIMYLEGGSGIRPFTFCLLVGLLVGTYSSVAIAAPLVFKGTGDETPETGLSKAPSGGPDTKAAAAGVT